MRRLILFELNEAERHFLDRFIDAGLLPNFERVRREGIFAVTRIPSWDARAHKAWRSISPWMVWPSLYTGLEPAAHGIVGFGQDTHAIRGKCAWDVLAKAGVSTGVFGSLMSYPPRSDGAVRYYVPECLADDPACIPAEATYLQDFCLFGARNYSQTSPLAFVSGIKKLMQTPRSGVSAKTLMRIVLQLPAEKVFGHSVEAERAFLLSYAGFDAFRRLYDKERPQFATLHMNHVAYTQHRYWRAAEPERFLDQLSVTDKRFFTTTQQRKEYEQKLAGWIRRAFEYSDAVLGELMARADDNTAVVVATGLGVRPFDPVTEIYNPVVRLVHEDDLFAAVGLTNYRVLHQMNPDLTINFENDAAAAEAADRLSGLVLSPTEPLFAVQRVCNQVFLELESWPPASVDARRFIRHRTMDGICFEYDRYVQTHASNDQSTAHHKDTGLIMAWSPGRKLELNRRVSPITAVAPTLLSWFGLPAAAWMADREPIWTESGMPAVG